VKSSYKDVRFHACKARNIYTLLGAGVLVIDTRWQDGQLRNRNYSLEGLEIFLFSETGYGAYGASCGWGGVYPLGIEGPGRDAKTHFNRLPMFRMSGAMPSRHL